MSDDADFHYPSIEARNLKLAMRIYENNPGYLDDPACPYDAETKAILKGQAKVHDFATHQDYETPTGDTLQAHINQLSKELKEYGQFIHDSPSATPQDKNTYFRLSSGLLDKQIEQREKISNIKQFEVFMGMILDFMDKELNADQRNLFIEKIKMLGGVLTTQSSSVTPEVKNKTEGEKQNDISSPIPSL